MEVKRAMRAMALLAAVSASAALLSACGGASAISQKDYDAVKAQLTAKEQEAAKLQQDLQARGTGAGAGAAATELRAQLAAKDKEIADLKASAASSQGGKQPLIWTQRGPLPPPAPTATPAPPGFVAPTPVPVDAATVSKVFPFTYYIEHLTGHQTSDVIQFPSCVPNSQFRRGAHMVWRFEVFDTSTGKRLTSLDSPTIRLVLPSGEQIPARFAQRGGTGPWTWVAAWDVPKDYPMGTLDYQITVKSKDGRSGTFDQDDVALVNKARSIDSRVQIVE